MLPTKEVIQFLKKLGRFLLLLAFFDVTLGWALQKKYFSQKVGRQYRTGYALEKTTADLLIFGASRAFTNYVPDVFEQALNMSCYNTGSPGQFILYDYATLRGILARYHPKMILLDLSPGEFLVETASYERLSFLLPYYKRNKAIQPIVDLKGPYEKYKLISSIYPYNSSLVVLALSGTNYYQSRNSVTKGYKPRTNIWRQPADSSSSQPYALDSTKLEVYTNFIKDCQQAGTQLIVFCSPTLVHAARRDYSILAAERIARNFNVPLLDFTNHPLFLRHPGWFDEPLHLNHLGSPIYSKILADTLQKMKRS